MWKCPVCDTEYDDSVLFCAIDGNPRDGYPAKAPEEHVWICPVCKTKNDGIFCKNCGSKKEMESSSAPDPSPEWRCNRCNAMNPAYVTVCMKCRTPRAERDNTELRKALRRMKRKKNGARFGVILCICAVLLLFATPYIIDDADYTVYRNISGLNGGIEKACSIVALVFAVLPLPFLLAKLDVRRRNLPFTMALVSAAALAVYCCVIFFGSIDVNAVMPLIVAAEAVIAFLSYRYVKLLEGIDNLLFRTAL